MTQIKRPPEAVRQMEEIEGTPPDKLKKNRHWGRTHELVWYILKKFKPGIELKETMHFFVHANSAKCCMNNKESKKAKSRLFKSCRNYMAGELEILSPDIVVIQGEEARAAVDHM